MYTAKQHTHLVERCANFAMSARHHGQIEAVAIMELFTVLAESGDADEFQDTPDVSADQVAAVVQFAQEFHDFLTGENPVQQKDRRPVTTPFLHGGR